jgi:hypothetical protein
VRRRIRNIGFPLLVIAALAVSGYLAASVRVPNPTPDFALQAAAVYRLEVGAACFAAFYLAAMALVLALDGRGFAEMGTKGLKAVEVVRTTDDYQANASEQARLTEDMEKRLERTNAALESAFEALTRQEQRLERLEERN